jgi:hypothetical protein
VQHCECSIKQRQCLLLWMMIIDGPCLEKVGFGLGFGITV